VLSCRYDAEMGTANS